MVCKISEQSETKFSIQQIAEKIKQFESEYGVLDDERYGRDARLAWETARFEIGNSIAKQLGLYGTAHTPPTDFRKLSFLKLTAFSLKILVNSIFHSWLFAPKNREYLIFCHTRRIKSTEGVYEEIYTDEIVKELGRDKCIIVERPENWDHRYPVPNPRKFDDLTMLLTYFLKPLVSKKAYPFLYDLIKDLDGFIANEFGITIDSSKLLNRAAAILARFQIGYRFMLKYLKPKRVLMVVSYGLESLTLAAKSLGIPTFEIQHGIITDYHLGYSVPENNSKLSFPDRLLVFGQFWKDSVNFSIPKEKIDILGYPHLQKTISKFSKSSKLDRILFLSQGTIGKHLSRFAVDFSGLHGKKVEVVYKLHPGEWGRWEVEYPWLKEAQQKDDVNVVADSSPSLYELFSTSKWQVGVYSTAVFEGLTFGCCTYLVDLPGVEYMKQLIERGLVKLVSSPHEIDTIDEIPEINGEYFFSSDWRNNLKSIFNSEEIR